MTTCPRSNSIKIGVIHQALTQQMAKQLGIQGSKRILNAFEISM